MDNPESKQPVRPASAAPQKINRKKNRKARRLLSLVLIILVIILTTTSVYFFRKYQNLKSNPAQNIEQSNMRETQDVIEDLGKILLLDANNKPTIARVEDPATLQKNNADFYKDIQKDDYLILYKDRAIIYRQSYNQIINIAPIVDADQGPKTTE